MGMYGLREKALMFGKKWDSFWEDFNRLMDQLPGVINESGGMDGVTTLRSTNGHIELKGKFKSLNINGRTIRVPKEVMEGA